MKQPQQPQFYVPSAVVASEAPNSPSVHKIHILGEDEKSRFIAHALCSVYNSVERIGWSEQEPHKKYCNIQLPESKKSGARYTTVPNAAPSWTHVRDDDSPIDQLVVTGEGFEAATALKAAKHRVTKQTTVCLMNEGLGVLDDVREKVFDGTTPTPKFVLGHMNHRLVFNRYTDAVKQIKVGKCKLTTEPQMGKGGKWQQSPHLSQDGVNFVEAWTSAQDLKSSLSRYDKWLEFKLPSMIFGSVVEPVCVMLELPYHNLLTDLNARTIMQGLLSEVLKVIKHMPEVQGCPAIQNYTRSNVMKRFVYRAIMAKSNQRGDLVKRIEYGAPTNVNFMNGYFIRRGKEFGLKLPQNEMARKMVKVKHSQRMEKLNAYVRMEETSIPSTMAHRFRTPPPE